MPQDEIDIVELCAELETMRARITTLTRTLCDAGAPPMLLRPLASAELALIEARNEAAMIYK